MKLLDIILEDNEERLKKKGEMVYKFLKRGTIVYKKTKFTYVLSDTFHTKIKESLLFSYIPVLYPTEVTVTHIGDPSSKVNKIPADIVSDVISQIFFKQQAAISVPDDIVNGDVKVKNWG